MCDSGPLQALQVAEEVISNMYSLSSKIDPDEWKATMHQSFTYDLTLFLTGIKNEMKQKHDEPKNEEQKLARIQYYRQHIFFFTPHLTIRLYALHSELSIPLIQNNMKQFLECWIYICKLFSRYLKSCDQYQRYPFSRESARSSASAESTWDWLASDDLDIIQCDSSLNNMDAYIRDTVIQGMRYIVENILDKEQLILQFFNALIDVLGHECIDEVILIEAIRAAKKVLLSTAKICIMLVDSKLVAVSQPVVMIRAQLIMILKKHILYDNERLNNEWLELVYDYLKRVQTIKSYHKEVLEYSLQHLKTATIEVKKKFFKLFDSYYGTSLYKRMEFIFFQQIWSSEKSLKDNSWIQQLLDLMLSTVDERIPVEKESNDTTLPSLSGAFSAQSEIEMSDKIATDPSKKEVPQELNRIMNSVELVINKLKRKRQYSWLRCLKTIISWEIRICEKLWPKLFPQFWSMMTTDEQQQIASLIEPFLARDSFQKYFQNIKHKIVKDMFEAISNCDPLPRIAPEIIQFIAKSYNIWYSALPMLESYIYAYPGNERYCISMKLLLEYLGENDYLIGLKRLMAKSDTTRAALAYSQFRMWNQVHEVLALILKDQRFIEKDIVKGEEIPKEETKKLNAVVNTSIVTVKDSTQVKSEQLTETKENPNSIPLNINQELMQVDLRIWEELEIEAAQNLNNWDLLKEITTFTSRPTLGLQYHWLKRNWKGYISIAKRIGTIGDPKSLLVYLYSLLVNSSENIQEKDEIYKRGLKTLYLEWYSLPGITSAQHYQSLILQQHFYEVNEFKIMLKDINKFLQKPGVNLTLPLNVWRNRLPNETESFTVWRDLLECRNYLFAQSKLNLGSIEGFSRIETSIEDIPWNLLKLAQVARKHGLIDEAAKYLSEADIYFASTGSGHNNEKVTYAKEAAKVAIIVGTEPEAVIEYLKNVEGQAFCKSCKPLLSEIAQLRGSLLMKLKKEQDGLAALNLATNVCFSNYKAWWSLGCFYELEFKASKQPKSNTQALNAFIHATMYMLERSKYFVPRIFQCLENDGLLPESSTAENSGIKTFTELHNKLPVWIWIYWIPQLLNNLKRLPSEREAARLILKNIATLYPQILFLPLRDMQEKAESMAADDAFLLAIKDVWTTLQNKKNTLTQIMKILDELEGKILFASNTESELLLHLKHLYSLCIPLISIEDFTAYMAKITDKLFTTANSQYNSLKDLYKVKFTDTFSNEAIKTRGLLESIKHLRNWIDFLDTNITLQVNPSFLNTYGHDLAEMQPKYVEMFGMNYNQDCEPSPEAIVFIARVEVKVRKSHEYTSIEFCGTDERNYVYYLEINDTELARVPLLKESLVIQLRNYINKICSRDRHALLNNVKLCNLYCFYWKRMKIILGQLKIASMDSVHRVALIERECHPSHASIRYLQELAESYSGLTVADTSINRARKNIIKEMKGIVDDHAFAGRMHKVILALEEVFVYKKQFTVFLAGQSLFSCLFKIYSKDLLAFRYCETTGKVNYANFIREESAVPFRLTPNLQYFITPIGIEGLFAGAMTTMAYALVKKLKYLKDYLKLFYRDAYEGVNSEDNMKDCNRTIETLKNLIDLTKVTQDGSIKAEVEKDYIFNKEIYRQIKEAQEVERLNEMPLGYAPWF